jgi:hypothetical protein
MTAWTFLVNISDLEFWKLVLPRFGESQCEFLMEVIFKNNKVNLFQKLYLLEEFTSQISANKIFDVAFERENTTIMKLVSQVGRVSPLDRGADNVPYLYKATMNNNLNMVRSLWYLGVKWMISDPVGEFATLYADLLKLSQSKATPFICPEIKKEVFEIETRKKRDIENEKRGKIFAKVFGSKVLAIATQEGYTAIANFCFLEKGVTFADLLTFNLSEITEDTVSYILEQVVDPQVKKKTRRKQNHHKMLMNTTRKSVKWLTKSIGEGNDAATKLNILSWIVHNSDLSQLSPLILISTIKASIEEENVRKIIGKVEGGKAFLEKLENIKTEKNSVNFYSANFQ